MLFDFHLRHLLQTSTIGTVRFVFSLETGSIRHSSLHTSLYASQDATHVAAMFLARRNRLLFQPACQPKRVENAFPVRCFGNIAPSFSWKPFRGTVWFIYPFYERKELIKNSGWSKFSLAWSKISDCCLPAPNSSSSPPLYIFAAASMWGCRYDTHILLQGMARTIGPLSHQLGLILSGSFFERWQEVVTKIVCATTKRTLRTSIDKTKRCLYLLSHVL